MSAPRTVAEVLRKHVTLEVEGIDRMDLNVYVADLQRRQGGRLDPVPPPRTPVCRFRAHGPDQQGVRGRIETFVQKNNIPLLSFAKGQRQDDIPAEYRATFTGKEGVLFRVTYLDRFLKIYNDKPKALPSFMR